MTALGWWPALTLLGLGAIHGVNPAMGWLFAVAHGLQAGERRALWRALAAVAAGHALAIGAALLAVSALGLVVPTATVRWCVVAALVVMGGRHLAGRHRHARLGGMCMRTHTLVLWSFVVASVHGAGAMVVPLMPGAVHDPHAAHIGHAAHVVGPASTRASLLSGMFDSSAAQATLWHTAGYLLAATALALLVYETAGWRLLRAWINLDRLWGVVLLVTAVAVAWS